MNKIYLFSLLFCFCFSCNKKGINPDLTYIDLDNSRHSKLSDVYENVKYIVVEELDSLPIVQPYKVVFHKSLIFIEDNMMDNLFLVNMDGKVEHIFLSSGNGPGEFNQIEDFQVEDNEVIIKDLVSGKFISYDFMGNVIHEERIRNMSTNFFKRENFILHFFNNKDNEFSMNFIAENKDSLLYTYYPIKREFLESGRVFNLDNGFVFDKSTSQILLTLPYSYDVAFFDDKGRGGKLHTFNFGKYSLSDRLRLQYSNGSFINSPDDVEDEYVGAINRFFPFKDFYYLAARNGKDEFHIVFLDKQFEPLLQVKEFDNDLDGLPHLHWPSLFYDNHLIVRTRSNYMLELYEENQELMRSKHPHAIIHDFVGENKGKLSGDNLAFILYKIKPDLVELLSVKP